MTCRSCDAEIADKAIVCYRCGTPTAAGHVAPGRPAPARAGNRVLLAVVVVLVAVAGFVVWLSMWKPAA